jgi:hypothetical protein
MPVSAVAAAGRDGCSDPAVQALAGFERTATVPLSNPAEYSLPEFLVASCKSIPLLNRPAYKNTASQHTLSQTADGDGGLTTSMKKLTKPRPNQTNILGL